MSLLEHFRTMQAAAVNFLEPTVYLARAAGRDYVVGARCANGSQLEKDAFVNDLIYMLDGPEQREAEEEFELLAANLEAAPYSNAWNGYQDGHVISPQLFAALMSRLRPAAPEEATEADSPIDPLLNPITDAENDAAYRRSMAFNAEAARSGLFAAALDIAEEMKKGGVPQADAAIMTGAIEMAAQLWQNVGHAASIPTGKVRANFLQQAQFFFSKHLRATRDGAKTRTMQ